MMSPNPQPVPDAPEGHRAGPLAEAARYALLRRLAPSMRHHLVVNLQPIGMIYEVMDRRLKAPQPDLAEVRDGAQKINRFAKAALNSCLDIVTWLSPDLEVPTSAEAGVRECLGLVATSLTFRGYTLRNEVGAAAGQVRRSAIRNVLTAALIHATDTTPAPADLVLTAQESDAALLLSLTMNPTVGEPSFTAQPGYRKLEWADLAALAEADAVVLTREGRLVLRLALPWARASNS